MRKEILLVSVLLGAAVSVGAQQTIFNVPSSDILDKGKVYVELDATFKPNSGSSFGKFSSLVPRIVAGTGGSVEVGLNLTGNIQPGADSTTLVRRSSGGLTTTRIRAGRLWLETMSTFLYETGHTTSATMLTLK